MCQVSPSVRACMQPTDTSLRWPRSKDGGCLGLLIAPPLPCQPPHASARRPHTPPRPHLVVAEPPVEQRLEVARLQRERAAVLLDRRLEAPLLARRVAARVVLLCKLGPARWTVGLEKKGAGQN